MSLLDKFESVLVRIEDQLSPADLLYCQQEEEHYKHAMNQLYAEEKMLREYLVIENSSYWGIHDIESKSMEPWVTKSDTYSSTPEQEKRQKFYDSFKYTSAFGIVATYKLREKLREAFVKRIVDYFTKKYLLEIGEVNADELPGEIGWLVLIEKIKEKLGGLLDFRGGAVDQAFQDFRESISWLTPVVSGTIITVDRYWYWGRGSSHEFSRWGSDTTKLQSLDKAISVFELEEVRPKYAFAYLEGTKCRFEWEAPLNGEKVDSIKFFKNGKMQLKFKDSFLAQQFYARFQLSALR